MQKVCVTTLSLKRGGAERVVANLCNLLCNSYEVHLVLFSNFIDYKIDSRIKVHCYNNRKSKVVGFLDKIIWFRRLIKEEKVGNIFSFLFRPNIISIIAKAGLPNVHLVISERSNPTIYYRGRKLGLVNKMLIAFFYPLSDLVTVNSYGCYNELKKKYYLKQNKLRIIRNPIVIKENPIRVNRDNKTFVFITVGRLDENKNHLMLINAYEIFLKRVRSCKNYSSIDIQFRIIGKGSAFSELKNIINKKGLTSIQLLGEKDNIEKELKDSDVFLFGSRSEGFPNVLLEAMANNLPIISSDCRYGPGELLKDESYLPNTRGSRTDFEIVKSGILVDVDDYISLSKAMLYLFFNRDVINQFLTTYPEVLEKYREDMVLKEYEQILRHEV